VQLTEHPAAKRVLVADDDAGVIDVLQANLEADGYAVIVARNGEEALEMIRTQSPDLAVIDVMMPGRDGLDVLAAIREEPATSALPVVLLSARASDSEIWAGWQAGANYYMTKPFQIDELLHYLRYLTGQEDVHIPTEREG
jgi:DNA-binding response OmpR family regulator